MFLHLAIRSVLPPFILVTELMLTNLVDFAGAISRVGESIQKVALWDIHTALTATMPVFSTGFLFSMALGLPCICSVRGRAQGDYRVEC